MKKYKEIVSIINSNSPESTKFDLIVNKLCGTPVYEIELWGLHSKSRRRIKRKKFSNIAQLLRFNQLLEERKYPIHMAVLRVGYYSNNSITPL